MSTTELIKSDTPIGSIFFSGSQTVTKGNAVTWILDDTWAFKATEKCKVSTNASPFVEIGAGQTFLIYKRTQDDIDAGNSKGIYIFDRDTVIALAYPQEVTQDLIIENENYNNTNNTIIIEEDKTPVAKISFSNTSPVVGETITISGAESYAHSPATIQAYEWTINGTVVSTAKSFTRSFPNSYEYDVSLKITDNGSPPLVGDTKRQIKVRALPTYADIAMSWTFQTGINNGAGDTVLRYADATSTETGTGDVTIKTSIACRPDMDGRTFRIKLYKNNALIKQQDKYIEGNVVGSITAIYSAKTTIRTGDKFHATVEKTDTRRSYDAGIYVGSSPQLSVTVTNRTS